VSFTEDERSHLLEAGETQREVNQYAIGVAELLAQEASDSKEALAAVAEAGEANAPPAAPAAPVVQVAPASPVLVAPLQAPSAMLAGAYPVALPRSKTVLVQGAAVVPQPYAAGLQKLRSTPVTGGEVQGASMRAAKTYIPLQAWAPSIRRARHTVAVVQPSTSAPPGESSSIVRSLSASVGQVGEIPDDVVSGRQVIKDNVVSCDLRMYKMGGGRIQHGWELRQLKHRIPTKEEMNSVSDAEKRLKEEKLADASASGDAAPKCPETFDELQNQFLTKYEDDIKWEMPGVTLQKADVGVKVQERFMEAAQQLSNPDEQLIATYHGTNSDNFQSIQQKGLLVPGHGGVSVANGSAHGVGVYTAKLGSSRLSKNFCQGGDKMFVCAVADPKGEKLAAPASALRAVQKWIGTSQPGGQRYHRNHHKAAGAPASSKIGNQVGHRERNHVRHVGDAVVVFDERCVTPLLVANGIKEGGSFSTTSFAGNVAKPGAVLATRQVKVGEQHFWVPPEEDRWRKGMLVRRVMNTKARDADRRLAREEKEAELHGAA